MKKTEDPYKAMLMLFRNVGGKAGLQSTVQIGTIVSPPPEIKVQWMVCYLIKSGFI